MRKNETINNNPIKRPCSGRSVLYPTNIAVESNLHQISRVSHVCAGACPPSAYYMAVTQEAWDCCLFCCEYIICYYRCFKKPPVWTELCKKQKNKNKKKKKEREKLDCMHLNWSGEMQEATLTTPPLTHSSLYRWMSLFHHWNTTRSNDRYSPLQPCQKDAVSSSRQDSKQCRRAVSGKFSSFQRYFSFTWSWEEKNITSGGPQCHSK